jgi:phosphohistidine phosphatase
MHLLLIRHARAADRGPGTRDASRRLTKGGRADMRKAAKGLARLIVKLDVLATSPLVRARETADIVADVLDSPAPNEVEWLAPGGAPAKLLAWIAGQPAQATVALVGHEPDLSRFAGYVLSGAAETFIEFKKGAAGLIGFEGKPAAGDGRLLWLLAPGQLRRLAG